MATVNGLSAERMEAIEAACVISGVINEEGHLILTQHGGGTIDAGAILGDVPNASTTVRGVLLLASAGDITTGTNTTKAVTPAQLAAVSAAISGVASASQPLDTDLTAIAGLAPSNNDFIQRKSGSWTNRSPAQVLTDLVNVGASTTEVYSGATYGLASGAITYVGDTDPGGSAADGSVWFDTSGS
jgi:hypothetical protein